MCVILWDDKVYWTVSNFVDVLHFCLTNRSAVIRILVMLLKLASLLSLPCSVVPIMFLLFSSIPASYSRHATE